jgi:acetyltransferase-like isoleucine patch superfamily enzyme
MNRVGVHPTAVVDDGASIGPGTRVWHHCHVRDGAVVGADATLGKNVFVDAGAVIRDRVKIQNDVSVFSGVTLHDEVFAGPTAALTLTNDLRPRAVAADWQIVPTEVHHGASIGANATIVCGTTIGRYAMVGAGAVMPRSVPSHAPVRGNPARVAGWVCRCGEVTGRDDQAPEVLACGRCVWDGHPAPTANTPDRPGTST